ncbi:group II intron reverse transcriptase/maturase [Clostridium tetanomorphum]|uniref:group II intron reverse transcriptase/maturase n=1 Tax=Clostridium tetanomorphum TaxID=1553 RepID=UPI000D9BD9DD|nr:group II intron reverse transcriptase/maturase [Clostridium tetanomorphum]NRS86943.1 group II intron reverse transcriptase/maturase [Clostridium tetanomorphum]SQC00254.1 RNA-directed DNA polymerase [Clostridium tetanomorphum]
MSTKLDEIAIKARKDKKAVFTSLAHIITPEFLKETWKMMNRKGASGVDGETTKEFEYNIDERVKDIWKKMKEKKYKAPPVRRVEIPKGNGKTRPLGIPTVEDRLVQRAAARILESIYEQEFMDFSYGFRPRRNPHQALKTLRECIVKKKVRFIYEADIRGYFNHINHQWLMKMIKLRIADPVIISMIGKWLRSGVMVNGVVTINTEGTPQGGPISPILANIYLHYVLDLWFAKKYKAYAQGEAYLIRFADDYVACFQYKRDAEKFEKYSKYRMNKFHLELAEEKTRLISFGRYARERSAKYDKKPETFDFLGFRHISGVGINGQFALIRKPTVKSCRKFLDKTHKWLKEHIHWKRRDQQKQLTSMLRGFYQYFSLYHCGNKLMFIRQEVVNQWIRSLRRRSQRHRLYWSYLSTREWFKLPYPELIHADI